MGPNPIWLVSLWERDIRGARGQRDDQVKRQRVAICKPRREASGQTNPADTLILDFQPPELWENKCPVIEATKSMVFCYSSSSKLIHHPSFLGCPHQQRCNTKDDKTKFLSSQELWCSLGVDFDIKSSAFNVCLIYFFSILLLLMYLMSVDLKSFWTFLVVLWINFSLPVQGTQVWSLVREDSTCCRATKLMSRNSWSLCVLDYVLHKRSPAHCN